MIFSFTLEDVLAIDLYISGNFPHFFWTASNYYLEIILKYQKKLENVETENKRIKYFKVRTFYRYKHFLVIFRL